MTTVQEKIKVVIVDEIALCYVYPEMPNSAFVVSAKYTKGCLWENGENVSMDGRNVRIANLFDCDDYRMHLCNYIGHEDEMEFSTEGIEKLSKSALTWLKTKTNNL